jgi:hypothetical protein
MGSSRDREVLTNNGNPRKFRKIVVTDDNGNFVIPDLPNATYNAWVYGTADGLGRAVFAQQLANWGSCMR